jgi:adenine phosphoribosyltransferase
MEYKDHIRDIPDFPIKGVMFRDVSPLLANPVLLKRAIRELSERIDLAEVDAFAGIESRGFIFASALAMHNDKGFIPLRKVGKLPPPTIQASYVLEYGEAILEVHAGKGRVVIIDDVLATGGTMGASIELCEKAGYDVHDVAVLIDLRFLNEFRFRGQPVKSLVQY